MIEEVARTVGYDVVPAEPLAGRIPESLHQPEREVREEVRDLLVGGGMLETISYTLVGGADVATGPAAAGGSARGRRPAAGGPGRQSRPWPPRRFG